MTKRKAKFNFEIGDWVAQVQSRTPRIGIVKSTKYAGKIGGRAEYHVTIRRYNLDGTVMDEAYSELYDGHYYKISPPVFPIVPDKNGNWHYSINYLWKDGSRA